MSAATPIELPHSFELYMPTQCRCGKELPAAARDDIFAEVKRRMVSWFGGATILDEPLLGLGLPNPANWPRKALTLYGRLLPTSTTKSTGRIS